MIATWSVGDPDAGMAEDILVDLNNEIHGHPWWQARAQLAVALLRQERIQPRARVLDAGCGWGVTLEALEKDGYRAAGLDISRRCLQTLVHPSRELIEADLTQPLPSDVPQFDAALALDVIEHLDDDHTAVARLGELVRPDGVVVVSVPALPDLYSEFDLIQGHRRRYLPDMVRRAFQGTGLVLKRILWWGQWLVPLLRRRRGRRLAVAGESTADTYRRYLSLPPWPLSLVLPWLFRLEQPRTLRGVSTTGTSLFAVARRPK
jgi:SAM-dependent methyltransferase